MGLLVYKIIVCHLIGDYVLQSDFLAKTKGSNYYHLWIHSMLYTVPFMIVFGFDPMILCIILNTHFAIDLLKAKYKLINYIWDQILHYIIIFIIYIHQ